jgi:hypothetical protein
MALIAAFIPPMKTKLLLCAVGFASFLFTEKAQSQSLTVHFVEISPNVPVNGSVNGSYFLDYPSGVALFQEFQAFCVDPLQDLSYGETVTYDIQDAGTLTNSLAIAKLVGGYLASDQTAEDAAAVQWAIWEVVAELSGSSSLLDGNVVLSPTSETNPHGSTIASLGNQYLANIDSFTPATLTYLYSETHQDVVTWEVVPEPATAGLAVLSALMLFRRRR